MEKREPFDFVSLTVSPREYILCIELLGTCRKEANMSNRVKYLLDKKIPQQRGNDTEDEFIKGLRSLRDEYNVPIKIEPSKKGSKLDRQGVDVQVKGEGVLHLWIGIDAKSSKKGVEGYRQKQRELIERGVRNAFPRYPFHYDRFSESEPQLLLDLLRFIVKKSRTHSNYIDLIPERAQELGDNVENFNYNLRKLITYLFDELEPIYN